MTGAAKDIGMSTTITIVATGTYDDAVKRGQHWGQRFDVRKRSFTVTAQRINNSMKWKVVIKYQEKGSVQEVCDG